MKSNEVRIHKFPEAPKAWREGDYAPLPAGKSDTFDDRVSEEIFDDEGEWAEVDICVHRINHDEN